LPSSKVDKVISEPTDTRVTAHAFAAGQAGKRSSQQHLALKRWDVSGISGTVPTQEALCQGLSI